MPKKLLPIVGGLVLLVVGVVVGGKVMGGSKAAGPAPTPTPHADGEVVELEPMTVNLADPGRHYARIGLGLVLPEGGGEGAGAEVKKKVALMKDRALTTIGMKTSAELRTVEGQQKLREELTKDAEATFNAHEEKAKDAAPVVLRVVLTEIVVE
jgi:flagellar basal body-associated protein FliL